VKTNYHEEELVVLRAPGAFDRARLGKFLQRRGFKLEDEFYYLPRKGRSERWQTTTLVTIDVIRSGQRIYETEEDIAAGLGTTWDELRASYLLASLPRECIASFVQEIDALTTEFNLSVGYNGDNIDPVELGKRLNLVADELAREWDEPGSETLVILIEQEYGSK